MTPPDRRPLPDRRPPLVPSHVAWPAFVVFLLALSVAMAVVAVVVTRSDGGARPVETVGGPARR
jgi:hypothetical protein